LWPPSRTGQQTNARIHHGCGRCFSREDFLVVTGITGVNRKKEQPPIEQALDADSSISRRLAERYLGEVRKSDPRRNVDQTMEAQIEDAPTEDDQPPS
jgi:hypothetical protein